MKIRQGFVSNSSSSSFICAVCGDVQVGYDLSMREAGMYECEKGHTFCEGHLINDNAKTYILAGKRATLEEVDRYKKYVSEYQEKIDNGLGEEKTSTWSSAKTYAQELEDKKAYLEKLNGRLEKLDVMESNVDSEDFREDILVDFVESEIYADDFRYSCPVEMCPVCADNKAKQETRDVNATDPDWITYTELYKKFNGLSPQ
jgi:hypothetical protein